MYSAQDYSLGLLVYGLAGLGCMLVWWQMTAWIRWRPVRECMRMAMFLLIFTPWYAEESMQQAHAAGAVEQESLQLMLDIGEQGAVKESRPVYLAPAVAIVAFELLNSNPEGMMLAMRPLLAAQLAGLALVVFVSLLRSAFGFMRRDPLASEAG